MGVFVFYDVWSRVGVHYLRIIIIYMKEIKVQENDDTITRNELARPLLSDI